MKTLTGTIVYYKYTHGFIEGNDGGRYFFLIDKSYQKQMKRDGIIDRLYNFDLGDEVAFTLVPSLKNPELNIARDIKFIGNEPKQQLIEEAKTKVIFTGKIKLIEERYYVKPTNSKALVRIDISDWEDDINTF